VTTHHHQDAKPDKGNTRGVANRITNRVVKQLSDDLEKVHITSTLERNEADTGWEMEVVIESKTNPNDGVILELELTDADARTAGDDDVRFSADEVIKLAHKVKAYEKFGRK
jgi:hypothetical protein